MFVIGAVIFVFISLLIAHSRSSIGVRDPIHSSTHYISDISPAIVCRPNIALYWIAYIFLASYFLAVFYD